MKIINLDELLKSPTGTVFRCTNPDELRTSQSIVEGTEIPILGKTVWVKEPISDATKDTVLILREAFPAPKTYRIMNYIDAALDAQISSGSRKFETIPDVEFGCDEKLISFTNVTISSLLMKTFVVYETIRIVGSGESRTTTIDYVCRMNESQKTFEQKERKSILSDELLIVLSNAAERRKKASSKHVEVEDTVFVGCDYVPVRVDLVDDNTEFEDYIEHFINEHLNEKLQNLPRITTIDVLGDEVVEDKKDPIYDYKDPIYNTPKYKYNKHNGGMVMQSNKWYDTKRSKKSRRKK